MSDDPELPPEQEARLRRLLAQARESEPVPVDVAARLDRVLEQLGAEEPDPEAGRTVVELTSRRRRRVRALLMAAAAVVVVGVGVGQLTTSDQDDTATSSDAGSEAAGAAAESVGPVEGGTDGDDSSRRTAPDADDGGLGAMSAPSPQDEPPAEDEAPTQESVPIPSRPPLRLTEAGFATQTERFRNRPGVVSRAGSVITGEELSRAESFVCDVADWGAGRLHAALYDGVPAVLAYRPVAGASTQTVDLLRCGTGEVLRSKVLPVERR